jgi:hypothetical protein
VCANITFFSFKISILLPGAVTLLPLSYAFVVQLKEWLKIKEEYLWEGK